jgi:catechol 2,3-dioxygenase-like lactoylglutathione lyase family enzyme
LSILRRAAVGLARLLAGRADRVEVELTRYLGHYAGGSASMPAEPFVGVAGDGSLRVSGGAQPVTVSVTLNGVEVITPRRLEADAVVDVSVTLAPSNEIRVALDGPTGSGARVRVKQAARVALHVMARVHFNTNVSDFARARAFYGRLGFKTLSGFPDANTLEMAQAIGVETPTSYDGSRGGSAGGYLLHGELISVGGFGSGTIDLIEFSIPRNDAPPYGKVNHLGMARAVLHTTDLQADYAHLEEEGVTFLSSPATRSDGTRFAVFTDPDGTYYELTEVQGKSAPSAATKIVHLGHLNVNVSDFERSVAWYRMLGYELTRRLPERGSLEEGRAMGLDQPFEIDGAVLTHRRDGSTIELVQWLDPHDAEPPYALPVNHIGIHRTALLTSNIEADVATLRSQGVVFISDPTPCCSGPDSWGSIVAFYDPDGTIVELVEQPFMSVLFRVFLWFRKLFA